MHCAENDIPFMAAYFANCPEIFTAMDVPWWIYLQTPFLGVSSPFLASDTDETEKMGWATDFCTVLRLAMFYVEKDLTPKPAGHIALLHPWRRHGDRAPGAGQEQDLARRSHIRRGLALLEDSEATNTMPMRRRRWSNSSLSAPARRWTSISCARSARYRTRHTRYGRNITSCVRPPDPHDRSSARRSASRSPATTTPASRRPSTGSKGWSPTPRSA